MPDESPRSDDATAPEGEPDQEADGVDGRVPTWVLGLVPLVVAGVMLVLALHV